MNRAQMINALPEVIEAVKDSHKKENTPVIFAPYVPNLDMEQQGEDEYEVLGYFISHNPLDKFRYTLLNYNSIYQLNELREGRTVTLGGIVTNLKEITTKTKKQMAFFDLEDLTGRVEVVVFSKMYNKYREYLKNKKPIKVLGRLENQTRDIAGEERHTYKIILSKIEPLKIEKQIEKIILYPQDKDDFNEIYKIIESNPGIIPLEINYKNAIFKIKQKLIPDKKILNNLEDSCLTRRIYASNGF